MSKVYPYTGKDIERASDGYVNSGVLRMWVSEGRLKAGGRAKGRGGPRTFSRPTVTKAVMMAELRKCGASLDQAEKMANKFLAMMKKIHSFHMASDDKGLDAAIIDLPLYFAIKPRTGVVTPITRDNGAKFFRDVMEPFGASVSFINVFEVMAAVDKGLGLDPGSQTIDVYDDV